MDLVGRKLWQHAAGDNDRNYVDLCLKWGVVLNGPGHLGAWPECRAALGDEGWSPKKLSDLRRFAEEIQAGDLVVLRLGTNTVPAVGVVVGDYEWADVFGDVDGWVLQHVRRVRWLWVGATPQIFPTYSMKLGDTTQALNDGAVKDWLAQLEPNNPEHAVLPAIPRISSGREVDFGRISDFLFAQGVASTAINRLMEEIGELTRIAKWYRAVHRPSEHETVAYLVVPLLRALGWTPQRMAVEWKHLDVALFESLPRADERLQVVVEAKKMDRSCISAKGQAAGYARGRPSCRRLIVTDGIRYGVYVKGADGEFSLYAYLNLTRLRDAYPVYGCHGAEEALLAMSPDWKPDITVLVHSVAETLDDA